MMQITFKKLVGLATLLVIAATMFGPGTLSQKLPDRTGREVDVTDIRPCSPRTTIGGRLTERSTIRGRRKPRYSPIVRERVFLLNERGEEVARTRTDGEGFYRFALLCPGSYTVRPRMALESPLLPSPYEPSSRTVGVPLAGSRRVVRGNGLLQLDFEKQPPPPTPQSDPLDRRG